MSEKFNDGGAAFPCEADGGCGPWEGMTLRDYFAGQSLACFFDARVRAAYDGHEVAKICYEIADAMLAERNKSHST